MQFRRGNSGPGQLPLQLQGLNSWHHIHPAGVGQFHDTYFDVCWVPNSSPQNPNGRGVYLLAGTSVEGLGSANAQMLALGPAGGPMLDISGISVGGVSPITGVATYRIGQALVVGEPSVKVVAVGCGNDALFARGADVFTGGSWSSNGSWATAAIGTRPTHVAVTPAHNYMHAAGHQAGTGRYISRKALSSDNTDEWAHPTIPGGGAAGGSIVKLEAGWPDYVMALDSEGKILASANTTGSSYFEDTSLVVFDIAYSAVANKFAKATSTAVSTADAGDWGAAGPINWTLHPLPSAVAATHIVAIDCGWPTQADGDAGLAGGEGPEAWWLMMSHHYATGFVTKDFVDFYSVPLPIMPHVNASTSAYLPGRLKLKFCKDRLFIFGRQGVSVSGPLGFGYQVQRP